MQVKNTPEFIDFLKKSKPNTKFTLNCPQCGCEFTRPKKVLLSKFLTHNLQNIFCSHKCSCVYRKTSIDSNCKQCNAKIIVTQARLKKLKNHFCGSSCSAKYSNTHKVKGTRRSKLEVWLESKLTALYPALEFKFNNKETINAELDIYIKKFKIAFELNGIFHYEPIYGKEKLSSIQDNDNRKFQACLEKDIELVIIDTSGQTYFKESTSQKYLDIITNIINLKINQNID